MYHSTDASTLFFQLRLETSVNNNPFSTIPLPKQKNHPLFQKPRDSVYTRKNMYG